jgi:ATPase subunit of ABC transporter with duplicated ATPase domains
MESVSISEGPSASSRVLIGVSSLHKVGLVGANGAGKSTLLKAVVVNLARGKDCD